MDEIDQVLVAWYEWSQRDEGVHGYPTHAASCGEYRAGRSWMSDEDYDFEIDHSLQASIGAAVEPVVMALGLDHRVAVMTAARNFVVGAASFRNPRHPERQAHDYAAAKEAMRPALVSKGLVAGAAARA
ncbi:hypothetical protein [Chitinasiproducens palmae]|uniref:Phage protein n=1 Tax=Chitinasiproducens palmae TaxID=1770053 RepID=A0A1H2PS76_9BURK|nr:hypothetical protein [Chitinasiproducens palmae]SDV49801.1 hypothetical protein SAMN05216551_109148 [Chitinasiproducens palmae]